LGQQAGGGVKEWYGGQSWAEKEVVKLWDNTWLQGEKGSRKQEKFLTRPGKGAKRKWNFLEEILNQ